MIADGVRAKERQPKAVLPLHRAVTGSAIAAKLAEHCRNMPLIRRWCICRASKAWQRKSHHGNNRESARHLSFGVSVKSQSFTVLSHAPAAMIGFLGWKAIQSTSLVCFNRVRSFQLVVSQSTTSLGLFQSPSPTASVLPSGLKATLHTSPVCLPFSDATSVPSLVFHTRVMP